MVNALAYKIRDRIGQQDSIAGLATLVGAALVYGVLHALGPGHQKSLISGYLIANGGNMLRVLATAGIAAASHALSVIALFGGLALANGGLRAAQGEAGREIVTKVSALLLVGLALYTLAARIRNAFRRIHETTAESCSCGRRDHHTHHSKFIIFIGSLAPCPGAAFFLLLGFSVGNPVAGIAAVAAISAGMWVTLVLVGSAALAVHNAGEQSAVRSGGRPAMIIRSILEIFGILLILTFAVLLLF